MQQQPSPREQAQTRLVEYLESDERRWSAPYGVIAGMSSLPRGGKVRNVTFGVSAYLDAQATIWSATRIVIEGRGPLGSHVEGTFASVDEAIAHLKEAF